MAGRMVGAALGAALGTALVGGVVLAQGTGPASGPGGPPGVRPGAGMPAQAPEAAAAAQGGAQPGQAPRTVQGQGAQGQGTQAQGAQAQGAQGGAQPGPVGRGPQPPAPPPQAGGGGAAPPAPQGQRQVQQQAQQQHQAAQQPPAQALDEAELHAQARQLFQAIPSMVPTVQGNPVTREKVDLGRMLFFDPRLSASGVLSCNSCHNLAMGGADNIETSIGHGWQRGSRNSPTVLNAVFNVAQFWDGRAADLRTQATGPIQASVEMAATPQFVMSVLGSIPDYQDRFRRAFPGEGAPLTFDNLARALEAFEATLITPNSRFDQWLEGNRGILSDQEKRGLSLFVSTGCVACHAGVNFGGQDYYPFGVVERPGADILPPEDRGRFQVTRTATDDYVFRAVPLRNVALTAPYFHSGRVWDLRQAVAVMGVAQLGAQLAPDEVDAITAFLHTLTGEQPRIELPLLPASTDQTPRPQPGAMPQSVQQAPGPQR